METSEDWPDWGRLIDDARERVDLSQNEAARRADVSGTRWRQIVSGAAGPMASGRGVKTVARMASVAGVAAKDLEGIRDDVADILRAEEAARPAPQTEADGDLLKLGREMIEQGKRLEEIGWRILGKNPEETDEEDDVAG